MVKPSKAPKTSLCPPYFTQIQVVVDFRQGCICLPTTDGSNWYHKEAASYAPLDLKYAENKPAEARTAVNREDYEGASITGAWKS